MPRSLSDTIRNIPLKTVFLVDGTGATLSAIFLFGFLRSFPRFFGMPGEIITPLALAAACLAVYAFSCYLFAQQNLRGLLIPLLIANAIYALVTVVLVFKNYSLLTGWGFTYFTGELILIAVLVCLEIKNVRRMSSPVL